MCHSSLPGRIQRPGLFENIRQLAMKFSQTNLLSDGELYHWLGVEL
jgi:hypothetical protein